MQVIEQWTGRQADALRLALHLTLEQFAELLEMSPRQVANWRKDTKVVPRAHVQRTLHSMLESAPNRVKAQFAGRIFVADASVTLMTAPAMSPNNPSLVILNGTTEDIDAVIAQLADTGVSDDVIQQIERATVFLAESHTQAPARKMLSQVMRLHRRVQSLLEGKIRLSQQRELYRIESLLLSHACLLIGDLDQNEIAERYGNAALAYAREAESDQAAPMTVLAKTYRWQERLTESMEIARRGFECSPGTPIRIQLASQEANAAALLGDAPRARQSLTRAEVAAESVAQDSGLSAWSFPVARQAVFAQSVATQLGDANGMLRAASLADSAWAAGQPMVAANWAQIRIGAASAYLMRHSLEGTFAEVEPVLALPPGMRVATVTAYAERLRRQLQHSRYDGAAGVLELRDRLAQFGAEAFQDDAAS
jgi:transcriptional regulator with XRE-family HTH domain